MQALSPDLRRRLERTVTQARDVAEAGARAAMEALAVHHHEPYGHMNSEQRNLRRRLRAHARQLGDRLDVRSGGHGVDCLVHECAYEHWHGMLFARFLAENDLLIEPKMSIAISLDECEDLAKEEGVDKWALAARFAHHMLPQVFRPDHPVFEVPFAREHRLKLEGMLEDLPTDVFTATDSLGWVYQFWQTKKKDEVNRSEVKIGADELPAVTQLFTEPYMVQFLLHNSLGAWWVSRHPEQPCPVELTYLRKVEAASRRFNKTRRDGASTLGFYDPQGPLGMLSGNLPHWRQDGVSYFVTFRTADSLPQEKLKQWQEEREQWVASHPEPHSDEEKCEYHQRFSERIQQWLDAGYGECVLAKPGIKTIVEQALRHFDGDRYHLHEFVVMPNHVHALVSPLGECRFSDILHSWKSFTAHKINKHLGTEGPFWQKESFDHVVRNAEQAERIRQYIHDNPKVEAASRRFNKTQGRSGFQPLEETRRDGASTIPVVGEFEGWPNELSEFRLLDPCCGSGHFLVAAFLMLVPMRMALEGLSSTEAVDAVLHDNLHGLELDQRCVAIAVFALALEAWRYPDAGGYRPLPRFNLAWCGQPVVGKREQWLALAEGDNRIEAGMAALYDTFRDAPVLGSLIDPSRSVSEDMLTAGFTELEPLLEQALREHAGDEAWAETAIAARGLADAARLLTDHYHLVVTNVPYLTRGKQSERLRKFCEQHYSTAKNDLANVFLERCLELGRSGVPPLNEKQGRSGVPPLNEKRPEAASTIGVIQIVMPQNWLFLTSYKKQREHLLKEVRWDLLARLGPGAFDTISGEVVNVILLTLTHTRPHVDDPLHGIDASAPRTAAGKAEVLLDGEMVAVSQQGQLGNPDARVALGEAVGSELLSKYADGLNGMHGADSLRFRVNFWEIRNYLIWHLFQCTHTKTECFGGKYNVFYWDNNGDIHRKNPKAYVKGENVWGKLGVVVSMMRELPVTLYFGDKFDISCTPIIPHNPTHLPAIWCFCSSPEYNEAVRRIDQKLNVTNATLVKVPFDLDRWAKVAAEKYPHGLPKPYSDDPTQWIFHGHPCGSVVWDGKNKRLEAASTLRTDATVLQVAVARLLGYHWPVEAASRRFNKTQGRSGFQPLEETRRDGASTGVSTIELADEAREWVEKAKTLYPFEDEDGIVCIPSVRGERSAVEWLLDLLRAAYADKWHDGILAQLLTETGSQSLDDWLRNNFFEQHCKLFHHRPFIWHIWDGRKRDGFHALVNYHKLAEGNGKGRRLLESLTYSYLGDWISRQQDGVKRGEGGAEDRLAAALELQKRLVAIIKGEPPFDIFVRWKPIVEAAAHRLERPEAASTSVLNKEQGRSAVSALDEKRLEAASTLVLDEKRPEAASTKEQPIGWEPDINDGVRLNIRPFMAQDIAGGKKGAGILRAKPNVHWKKDRGKEPMRDQAQFPWFWNNDKFTGERINDVHLTNTEKKAARERSEGKQP